MNINNHAISHRGMPQVQNTESTAHSQEVGLSHIQGGNKSVVVLENKPTGFDSTVSNQVESPVASPTTETVFQAKNESMAEGASSTPRPLSVSLQDNIYVSGAVGENSPTVLSTQNQETLADIKEATSGVNVRQSRSLFESGDKGDTVDINSKGRPSKRMSSLSDSSQKAEPTPVKASVVSTTPDIQYATVEELPKPQVAGFVEKMYDESGQEIEHSSSNEISIKLQEVEAGNVDGIKNIHDSGIKDNYFLKLERGEIAEQGIQTEYGVSRGDSFLSGLTTVGINTDENIATEEDMDTTMDDVDGNSTSIEDSSDSIDGTNGIDTVDSMEDVYGTDDSPSASENVDLVDTMENFDTVDGFGTIDIQGSSSENELGTQNTETDSVVSPLGEDVSQGVVARESRGVEEQPATSSRSTPLPLPAVLHNKVEGSVNNNNINISIPDMVSPLASLLEKLINNNKTEPAPAQSQPTKLGDGDGLGGKGIGKEEARAEDVPDGIRKKPEKENNEPVQGEEELKNKFPSQKEDLDKIKKDIGYTNAWQFVVNAGLSVAGGNEVAFKELMGHVKDVLNQVRDEKTKAMATGKTVVSSSVMTAPEKEEALSEDMASFKSQLRKMLQKQPQVGSAQKGETFPELTIEKKERGIE